MLGHGYWIPKVKWQEPEQALVDLPQSFSTATYKAQNLPEGLAATDCKSLFDLVTRTATPTCSEYRTMLNAKKIKEMLEEGVQLRWVASGAPTRWQLNKDNGYQFSPWNFTARPVPTEWWAGDSQATGECPKSPEMATFQLPRGHQQRIVLFCQKT